MMDGHLVPPVGGLGSYASICQKPYFYHPLAVFVPGILRIGDIADLCAMSAPRPLLMAEVVNVGNQMMDQTGEIRDTFAHAARTYGVMGDESALRSKVAWKGWISVCSC